MSIVELTPRRDIEAATDRDWFWSQIAATVQEQDAATSDQERQLALFRSVLQRLSDQELVDFIHMFHAVKTRLYSWRLWAAAYVINGGCSDDGFIDFRYWLISCGRAVAEAALADPGTLADLALSPDAASFELFGYEPIDEFMRRSGGVRPKPTYKVPIDAPSDPDWRFDFDDAGEMRRRLPKLMEQFGW
jgi:hypothetical protein